MMHPKLLEIVRRAVEDGVVVGWNEAYEDIEHPSDEQVRDSIGQAVIDQLHIYFEFEDDDPS